MCQANPQDSLQHQLVGSSIRPTGPAQPGGLPSRRALPSAQLCCGNQLAEGFALLQRIPLQTYGQLAPLTSLCPGQDKGARGGRAVGLAGEGALGCPAGAPGSLVTPKSPAVPWAEPPLCPAYGGCSCCGSCSFLLNRNSACLGEGTSCCRKAGGGKAHSSLAGKP